MHVRMSLLIMAATLPAVAASCGEPSGLSPVSGKVTYKGQPATGAVVLFHRAEGGPDPVIPTGVVDDSGGFRLDSLHLGAGAAPGKYRVTVRWPDSTSPADPRPKEGASATDRLKFGHVPGDRLKGRYARPDAPLLAAEIKPGDNQVPPFDLVD